MSLLEKVKLSLGIEGNYQDGTINEYIEEVKDFLREAGVSESILNSDKAAGVIARGVSDLWFYGATKLSDYFYQRVAQLAMIVED